MFRSNYFLSKVKFVISKMSDKITSTFATNVSNDTSVKKMDKMVWIDMEMTGLDINKDQIMEVACIVTDSNLNILAEGPDIIIHQPETILKSMDEWCTQHHGKTGLTQACLNSKTSLIQAENSLLDFVSKHVEKQLSPLAGNSVYMDRLFLYKYMPRLSDYLHHRIIDVSTIKELCRRWNLSLFKAAPQKEYTHRALTDIKESIQELQFYKKNFFNVQQNS